MSVGPAVELVQLLCPDCGVVFAVPRVLYDARAASGGQLVCPNGAAFRVGLPPRLEQLLAGLEAGQRAARERVEHLLREREQLAAEVATYRRERIDQVIGPATAEELE